MSIFIISLPLYSQGGYLVNYEPTWGKPQKKKQKCFGQLSYIVKTIVVIFSTTVFCWLDPCSPSGLYVRVCSGKGKSHQVCCEINKFPVRGGFGALAFKAPENATCHFITAGRPWCQNVV